jgi:hypothetical protein
MSRKAVRVRSSALSIRLRYAERSSQLKAPFLRRRPFDPSLTLTRRIPGTERKRRNRMKDAKDRPVWFSEPSRADDSWGRRGESMTSWVERATLHRARATRRFLNENPSALPKEHQAALYRALHDRWQSAFFEPIVARTLQVLGASI